MPLNPKSKPSPKPQAKFAIKQLQRGIEIRQSHVTFVMLFFPLSANQAIGAQLFLIIFGARPGLGDVVQRTDLELICPGFGLKSSRYMWVDFIGSFSTMLGEAFHSILRFFSYIKIKHFTEPIQSRLDAVRQSEKL